MFLRIFCRLVSKSIFVVSASILTVALSQPIIAQYSRTIHDGYTPSGVKEGAVAGSYPLNGFENVNLYNGMLSVSFPLMRVGGRGTAGYTMMLKNDIHWDLSRYWADNSGSGSSLDEAINRAGRSWMVGYGPGVLLGMKTADKTPAPTNGLPCPAVYNVSYLTRLTFVLPDGAEILLHDKLNQGISDLKNLCTFPSAGLNRGKVFVSADGESTTFISDSSISDDLTVNLTLEFLPSGYLLMKDGARYRIDAGQVSWIRDRNGNKVSFTYETLSPFSWRMLTATDSLNRVVSVSYASTSTQYDQISFSGFGGVSRSIKIWYSLIQNILYPGTTIKKANQLFPEIYHSGNGWTGDWFNNGTMISKIELPDQRTYQFFYNSYGEIARIILPTGGGFDYEYAPSAYLPGLGIYQNLYGLMVYRRVTKRVTYNTLTQATNPNNPPVGTREKIENYVLETPVNQWITVRAETRDSNNDLIAQSRHYFYGNPMFSGDESRTPVCYSWWPAGKEYKTEHFDIESGVAGSVLRSSDQIWSPSVGAGTEAACYGAPDPNSKVVEVLNTVSETNQVSKQILGYDQYNNQTDVWEHDFGIGQPGALIRRTHTDYLTSGYDTIAGGINNPNPDATIHIRSLPYQQFVYDANGIERARTSYEYDTVPLGGLVDRPGITGLVSRNNQPPGPNYSPTADTMRGNVTKVTRWLLASTGPNTSDTGIFSYSQYDVAGNVVKARDSKGNDSTFDYSDSFTGTFTANTFAFLKSATSPNPGAAYGGNQPLVSASVYDFSSGKVVSTTDPNSKITSFEYTDPLDRLTKVIRPSGGGQTIYEYGDAVGNLYLRTQTQQSTFPNVWLEDYVLYDGLGRTKRSAHNEGTPGWSVRENLYDALGRVSQVSNPFFASTYSAGAGSAWTTTTYDALSRVTRVTMPDGAHVDSVYLGNQVTVADQTGKQRSSITDGLGRLIQVNEAPNDSAYNYQTNYTYDALGNLIRVRQGGFPTGGSADPSVQFRRFYYDSLSRLVYANNPEQNATIAFNPPGEAGTMWTMKYEYDPNGNLTSRTDARNVITAYSYDALNRNTTVSYSDGTPAVSRYYDVAVSDGSDGGGTFLNGKGRLRMSRSLNLHPTSGQAAYSRTVMGGYDNLGRVTSQRQGFLKPDSTWQDYIASRTYDLASHVLMRNYPSGGNFEHTYGSGGRTNFVQGAIGEQGYSLYSSGMVYNAAGQMTEEQFGMTSPLYHTMRYNNRFQMFEVNVGTFNDVNNPASSTYWDRGRLRFFYNSNAKSNGNPALDGPDNNGNVLRQEHWVPTVVTQKPNGPSVVTSYAIPMRDDYSYDPINRITQVQGWQLATGTATPAQIYQQTYSYDKFGNRKLNQSQTWGAGINGVATADIYDVNKLTNRLMGMIYDVAGNMLSAKSSLRTESRNYDAENRMSSFSVGFSQNGPSHYVYDGDGRRVRRILSTGEFWQVYGIDGELLAEYQWNGSTASLKKEYGYRDGQLLVVADPNETNANKRVQWLIADHLGTPRMVVDKTGSLSGVTRHDYLPFGEELMVGMGVSSSVRQPGLGYAADSVRQKFTGYERDAESGLDFAEARYFGSTQGRFTSTDPYNPIIDAEDKDEFNRYLGQPQNWNRYVYVWNNPFRYIDPYGEKVYIVTHTVGNKKGDEEFKRAAYTYADEIRNSEGFDPKTDIVIVYAVQTKENFQFAVEEAKKFEKTYGKVEQVALFAHSGPDHGPVFEYGTNRRDQFLKPHEQLPNLKINWSDTAVAKFYGCNTANFCQNFSNAQRVSSYGFDTFSSISGKPNEKSKKYLLDPWYDGPLYLVGQDGRAMIRREPRLNPSAPSRRNMLERR